MSQSNSLLPRLSWSLGKFLTQGGLAAKDGVVFAAQNTARLAGECGREFVDGWREGRIPTSALERMEMCPLEEQIAETKPGLVDWTQPGRGDTGGDLT